MASPYEGRNKEERAAVDADQVELAAVRLGSVVIDAAADDERISGAIDDVDVASEGMPLEVWQELDLRQEITVGGALETINERRELLGEFYPFEVEGTKLVYKESCTGMYEFCLAISNARSITSDPYVRLPRLFERTTAGILKKYFGDDTKAVHLGWPRTPHTKFRKAVLPLRNAGTEWEWAPEVGLPEDPDDVKDETVDFVLIKRLWDTRGGRFYVFGQCACGNNWSDKLTEPNLQQFRKWFKPDYLVEPMSAFTTPFLMGRQTLREAARRSNAIVFDRARLVSVAERSARHRKFGNLRRRLADASELVFEREGGGQGR